MPGGMLLLLIIGNDSPSITLSGYTFHQTADCKLYCFLNSLFYINHDIVRNL